MQFKIYRSSAGSGKTFSLTKEYLKLALTGGNPQLAFNPQYFKSILAITFTRMASSEMKERILKQLNVFAKLEANVSEPMLALIIEELKADFKDCFSLTQKELCQRAAQIQQAILHNYTDFSVSTIDSFHNRVVQAFAQDLGLPYNYDLEESAEELVKEVIQLLQSRIQKKQDPALGKLFKQIIFKNIEDDTSLFFDTELSTFLGIIQKESAQPYIERAKKYTLENWVEIERKLWAFIKSYEKKIVQLGEEALALIHRENLVKEHFYNKGGIYTYFQAAAKFEDFVNKEFKTAHTTINQGKWTASKVEPWAKDRIGQLQPQLTSVFEQLEYFKDNDLVGNYLLAAEMRKRILFIGLLRTVKLELELLKYERGIVFFSDLTHKINEIIENDPIPYVYERIGEKYNHILIDEFQDTSKMQWHNLLPLITNSLAKQRFSMVVGDTKQSIYRWRGGQADMLANLPEVPTLQENAPVQQEIQLLRKFEKVETLTINRRSQKGIIDFNNHLYNYITNTYGPLFPTLKQFYAEVTQAHSKEEGSLITLELVEKHKELYNEAVLSRIVSRVNESLDNGFQLKDIAILIRANKYAPIVAQRLLKENIPVVSNESLLLVHSDAVRFLIGFMKLLVVPLTPNAKMELIKFLYEYKSNRLRQPQNWQGLRGEQFLNISQEVHNPAPTITIEYIKTHFDFTIDVDTWAFLPLYDLAEKIASTFSLWNSEPEVIYLQKTFDFIKKYTLSGGNQIKRFIEQWERKKDKLALQIPDSENAVKIITVHKSKGLEFPVVILPFAEWEVTIRTNGNLLWGEWQQNIVEVDFTAFVPKKEVENTPLAGVYHKEKEAVFIDAINVLYVATTRAERQLHIICEDSAAEKKGTDNIGRVSVLLKKYLLDNNLNQHDFNIEIEKESIGISQVVIKHGDITVEAVKEVESENQILLSNRTLGGVIDAIQLERESSSKRAPLVSDFHKAKKRGVLVHYIFEKINYADEVDAVITDMILSGTITKTQKEAIKEEINEVLSLPEISHFYQRNKQLKVLNERSIIDREIIRPDRVTIEPNQLTVIDYKTGNFNKSHERQVKEYMQLFQKMGYKNVQGFLVYTETPEAINISLN